MNYQAQVVAVLAAFLAHWLIVTRRQGFWTIDSIFVAFQTILALGTFFILDPRNQIDQEYSLVVTLPMVIYAFSSALFFDWTRRARPNATRKNLDIRIVPTRPTKTVVGLLFFSALVTLAYFQAVGYNVFLLGIGNSLTGQAADYQTLRINSYSGNKYFFPGYVNQFKNCILPAMTTIVCYWMFANRKTGRWLVAVPLGLLSLLAVLGTGQRGAFVLVVFLVLAFTYQINPRRFSRRALAIIGVGLPLFFIATFINGRQSAQIQSSSSSLDKLGVITHEVWQRAFYDNQWSGQMAFHYTWGKHVGLGSDWVSSMTSVLPKVGPIHKSSDPNLAQHVFNFLYGTYRGTAPPSLWGSVYYNFGLVGIILLPMILAFAFRRITDIALDRQSMNTFELVGMCGFSVTVGNWIAGGPEYILNAGAITYGVLWWIGSRQRPDSKEVIHDPSPRVGSNAATRLATTP